MMVRTQIERVSKALADETRLIIFEAIAKRGQMNCSEIVSLQGVTPATVSHHLKVLADAQLIECRRKGQFVYSKAVPGTMEEYTRSLTSIVRLPVGRDRKSTRLNSSHGYISYAVFCLKKKKKKK